MYRKLHRAAQLEHALVVELCDDLRALRLRQPVERNADRLRDRVEQLLHQPVHVGLEMLRGIRRGMLRLHRLLGRGVDREVVVVDEIVRMDELEDGVADLVEAAVVKIDAQQPHELAAVLDEHRARADGLAVGELAGIVEIVVARLILLLHDHAQRGVRDGRADAPPADGAVGDGRHAAVFGQDLMQHDLIIRAERLAEILDQHGILPEHLFRHGKTLLVRCP